MTKSFERILSRYDFEFPRELIAEHPASPRDSAKLLVYDSRKRAATTATFARLPEFLPKGSVLVLNDTKVLPARLEVVRVTGGKVKILFLKKSGTILEFLSPKKLATGEKLKAGKYSFRVLGSSAGIYKIRPEFPSSGIIRVLETLGEVPLPPYIKNGRPQSAKTKRDYQSVFAKSRGSVASPTASLHFTNKLIAEIRKRGCRVVFVTLHVNLGTFAPLAEHQLKAGKLHPEEYSIPKKTAVVINAAIRAGRPVIAVGTTVVRTLESAAGKSGLARLAGETEIFIKEDYKPKVVSGLITNFHVPRSSLLMLVSAFLPRKRLLELYDMAIKEKFRLFSFGDGMLVL